MRRVATLILATVLMCTQARANLFIQLPDGRYFFVPAAWIIFGFLALLVTVAVAWVVDSTSSPLPPPPPPPSPEDYDQQAALHRAKARALDAQAQLDESRANAALKSEERQEVETFLKQQRAQRPPKSTRWR